MPRLKLLPVRGAGAVLTSAGGEIRAPRAAATTPCSTPGRTWALLEARRGRPCPAPRWAIFLAQGRRAPVVGQVVRPADTPLRSPVGPFAHSALFVVCFQAPATRWCAPCGRHDRNECPHDSTRLPTTGVPAGAILRPFLGPRRARFCT